MGVSHLYRTLTAARKSSGARNNVQMVQKTTRLTSEGEDLQKELKRYQWMTVRRNGQPRLLSLPNAQARAGGMVASQSSSASIGVNGGYAFAYRRTHGG